jgi:hypothetical protein
MDSEMLNSHSDGRSLLDKVFHELITSRPGGFPSWIVIGWNGAIYLFGASVWAFFLNFGRLGFDLHDWTQEGPRYDFLRRALIEGRVPLFIGTTLTKTNRFLAIPDTVISPQVFLLRFIEPGPFVLVNSIFLYSMGFMGMLLLRRRLRWSALTFGIVSLLFFLCGYPMAHIAVGHSMWASYFLLPYLALLSFDLYERGGSWRWVGWMSLLQLGFFLQGGFHFVIWSMLFLALIGLFNHQQRWWVVRGLLFSVLLCMVRILPAAVTFYERENTFISGYFSALDLVQAFVALRAPEVAQEGLYSAVGWWEFDIYVGMVGLCFLLYFGVYRTLFGKSHSPWRGIAAPAIAMVILSMGKVFQPINALPLPLVNAERVSSRFIVLPFVIFLILGGVHFEKYIRQRRFTSFGKLGLLSLLMLMIHDLSQHARLWRVARMEVLFERTPVDIRAEILTLTDRDYTSALLLGGGLTMMTALALLWLWFRESRVGHRDKNENDHTANTREV